MHFDFHFTTVQTLWTLTFAALMVLLVVLMGRERVRRFPWFTAGIVMVALRLLTTRLLQGRLPQLTMAEVFIAMADISALLGILIAVEMARRAFGRASRRCWMIGTLVLLAIGAVLLWKWGTWPQWKTISFDTTIARLSVFQLLALKAGMLVDVFNIGLGVLVIAFGRRYGAGWRTHVHRILIGLMAASISQTAVQAIWQIIVRRAGQPHSEAEYLHVVGLREKLFNGNSVVYILLVLWWIWALWKDEPGTAPPESEQLAGVVAEPPHSQGGVALPLPEDAEE